MSKPQKAAKTSLARHSDEGRNPAELPTIPVGSPWPQGWSVKPFDEIADYQTGRTPARATPRYWATDLGSTPWVSIGDMVPHKLITTTAERISQAAVNETFRGRISKAGTLLMSFKLTIGRLATLGIDACHNEAIISIYPKPDINQKYLEYFLAQVNYSDYQDRAVKGNTLNQEKIDRIVVTLPPKPEQEKIAAVLWKLQRAIATQDKLLNATADLKASAMQRLFTHGLRGEPLKDTDIGPMPESWQLQSLGDVTKLERGRFTHRPRNEPRFYDGSTPFVQTGDVVRSAGRIRSHTQSLNADGVAISKVFPAGTILITIAANIGFTGILGFDSACPDSLIGITCSDDVDAEFLNYYLQTQQADMDRLAPKGTQKNINIQFLQPWPVKQPTVDEQRAIASVLATIDRKLAHHRAKRSALNDLFQTLLHQLMTAQVRVADLDIDVSEVTDHLDDADKMVGKPATATGAQLPTSKSVERTGKR
jgi:type I restriction enzyme S subunit